MSPARPSRRLTLALLAAAVGVPAVAGCGSAKGDTDGGGTGPTSTPGSPSATPEPTPTPTPEPPRAVRAGDTAHVLVTAASQWLTPGKAREWVDAPSMEVPVDLAAWNERMSSRASRTWLLGKLGSQAMLGGQVIVDEVKGDWARVAISDQPTPDDPRGMIGWVRTAQLTVDDAFARAVAEKPIAWVDADRATLTEDPEGRQEALIASFATRLPVLEETPDAVRVAVPGRGPAWLPSSAVTVRGQGERPATPTADDVIATGRRFLGLPYLWAGMSSYGFDCSGFTYTIFRHHGIDLPRDSGPQLRASGLPRVERADLRPGDLVFFFYGQDEQRIRHVALYIGDGRIIHAPETGKTVEIVDMETYDVSRQYAGAVRPPLA